MMAGKMRPREMRRVGSQKPPVQGADARSKVAEYVSPVAKTVKESQEWQTLLKRHPVVLSGAVRVQFRKQFFSSDWVETSLEMRGTTLVFYSPSMTSAEPWFAFPVEFTQLEYDDEACSITCHYAEKMSFTFVTARNMFKSWRESVKGAAELQTTSLKDFDMVHLIGRGATGDVMLGVEKATGKKVAIKVMEKTRIAESSKALKRVINERLTLEVLGDKPYFVGLHSAFQSEDNLYLVTDFCDGGDLERYMKRREYEIPLWQAKQIAAEIVLALEYVHSRGIVYRDLKLDNLLIDHNGHVKLADFGLSKVLPEDTLTKSFCGTLGYIAPEIVEGRGYGFEVDSFALGCVIFKLIVGRTPYYAKNRESYFRKVTQGKLLFPDTVPEDAQDLIRGLMQVNPSKRTRVADVKKHPFFADVNWIELRAVRPSLARKMFVNAEVRQMSTDSLLSMEKRRTGSSGQSFKSKDSGSWWEAGIPRVMSTMILGEKKVPKVPAVPGFLYAPSTEGLSRVGSVVSVASLSHIGEVPPLR